MVFYRDIWKSSGRPMPEKAVAVGDSLLLINSADMIADLKFPIDLTYSLLSIVCIAGELEFDIDLTHAHMAPNTMMVLGPGQTLISGKASPDFVGFSIVAAVKELTNLIPYMSKLVMCQIHMKTPTVIKLTQQETQTQTMFHELLQRKITQRGKLYNDMVIKRLGESIFYETLGLYESHFAEKTPAMHRRSDELLYNFLTLVEKHFREERSVGFYANSMSVTPKHLSAVVKDASGRTAGEWIDSFVIMEARKLLSASDKSIQQISADLNFPNQSFFGKYFKHHTGMSPRQYRTQKHRD